MGNFSTWMGDSWTFLEIWKCERGVGEAKYEPLIKTIYWKHSRRLKRGFAVTTHCNKISHFGWCRQFGDVVKSGYWVHIFSCLGDSFGNYVAWNIMIICWKLNFGPFILSPDASDVFSVEKWAEERRSGETRTGSVDDGSSTGFSRLRELFKLQSSASQAFELRRAERSLKFDQMGYMETRKVPKRSIPKDQRKQKVKLE